MADGGSLARRYARAIVELGQESGRTELFVQQLTDFLDVTRLGEGALADALSNPGVTVGERMQVLDLVLSRSGYEPLVVSFLRLLVDKRRFGLYPDIVRAAGEMADDLAGRVRATVTTALPMGPITRGQIQAALQTATGRTVILSEKVDPAIIGGIVAQVGDTVFDSSVRARLSAMEESLVSAR
jgi:F-type H+-transporting ATPase subunit delta